MDFLLAVSQHEIIRDFGFLQFGGLAFLRRG
jgi:hypothetical protein